MRNLIVVSGIALLLIPCIASEGKSEMHLIAHGTYSMVGNNANGAIKVTKLDEWRLYADEDRSYSVDIDTASSKPIIKEHYIFTGNLTPKQFLLSISSKSGNADEGLITISCDFGQEKIECHTVANDITDSPELAQTMPYVFMPTAESPSLDLPWFFQTIASQAERSVIGRQSSIPLITIEDGETAESTKLKVQEIEQVEYVGRERIQVAGQVALADKFRVTDSGGGAPENLWLSNRGLLLQASQQGNPSLVLTSYDGPPFADGH